MENKIIEPSGCFGFTLSEFKLQGNDGRGTCMQSDANIEQLERLTLEAEANFVDPRGILVEVGVFLGRSAGVIANAKDPSRELYLFDTWSGMPEKRQQDCNYHTHEYGRSYQLFEGDLSVPMEEAIDNMSQYDNIVFASGVFPQETSHTISGKKIHFAHVDIDFYEGTLWSLFYIFYNLVPGAKIVCHDVATPTTPGVAVACTEFMSVFKNECTLVHGLGGTAIITKNNDNNVD